MGIFRNGCEDGKHCFVERYDEEIVKMHNDYHETHVKKTYLFDICCVCGKIVYPEEEEEEEEKK
ncbi:MAG: hypothetical protein IMZ52_04755 [Actinobacteria bacterium]|nr:hypothetical protein [Actinomycetota bacterium]MBE3114775.1 hypothetical protein [Actinomycetota bacterium]